MASSFVGATCEPSAKQYYDKVVLGIDKALLNKTTELVNGTETIVTYGLSELGKIGDIKWDITLCLLLSWIVVFACLAKG